MTNASDSIWRIQNLAKLKDSSQRESWLDQIFAICNFPLILILSLSSRFEEELDLMNELLTKEQLFVSSLQVGLFGKQLVVALNQAKMLRQNNSSAINLLLSKGAIDSESLGSNLQSRI